MLKTILIVGASPTARVLLPALLRNWPCTLISAPDVLSAIHIADRVRVNAIVADVAHARVGAQDLAAFAAQSARLNDTDVYVLKHSGGETPLNDLAARGSRLLDAPAPANPIAALPSLIAEIESALRP